MAVIHHGRHALIRELGTGPEGVPQVQKIWRAWRPQAEIDREIACHTAAGPAAPKIYAAGTLGGAEPKTYMTMRRLGRNLLQYAAQEERAIVDVALSEIKGLYESLDRAGVLHNDADPRNAMVDEKDGRWYLVDFGKARMRDQGDGPHYNVKVTFNIMAVRALQSPSYR